MLGSGAQRLMSKVLKVIQQAASRNETTTTMPSKGNSERGEIQMAGKVTVGEGRPYREIPEGAWRDSRYYIGEHDEHFLF